MKVHTVHFKQTNNFFYILKCKVDARIKIRIKKQLTNYKKFSHYQTQ